MLSFNLSKDSHLPGSIPPGSAEIYRGQVEIWHWEIAQIHAGTSRGTAEFIGRDFKVEIFILDAFFNLDKK